MSLFGDKLFTSRLALCKPDRSTVPLIIAWSQSTSACGAFLTPEHYNQEQLLSHLASGVYWNDLEKIFLVATKEDLKPIGTAHYWQPPGKKGTMSMALKVACPEERGKGYGTEIQKFIIMYLFERLSVKDIEMYTDLNNNPQQRCLKKLGFELVESLSYDDRDIKRTGHLYRLTIQKYKAHPIYRYHYE